ETYETFLGWLNKATNSDQIFLQDLLEEEGYDLVYVDYEHGADYIERNAKLLKTVIRLINDTLQMEGSNEAITVLGISMGGVVARWALVEMERSEETHNVGTFISFDSPHNGAYVPAGLQEMIHHIGNMNIGLSGGKVRHVVP